MLHPMPHRDKGNSAVSTCWPHMPRLTPHRDKGRFVVSFCCSDISRLSSHHYRMIVSWCWILGQRPAYSSVGVWLLGRLAWAAAVGAVGPVARAGSGSGAAVWDGVVEVAVGVGLSVVPRGAPAAPQAWPMASTLLPAR